MESSAVASASVTAAASLKQSVFHTKNTKNDKMIESGNKERVGRGFETRSAPALTHVLPRIRPVGFPIYVAPPGGSIHSLLPSQRDLLSRKSPFLVFCVPVRHGTD